MYYTATWTLGLRLEGPASQSPIKGHVLKHVVLLHAHEANMETHRNPNDHFQGTVVSIRQLSDFHVGFRVTGAGHGRQFLQWRT